MVKLIVAVKRRADMSPEAFHEYWRTTHASKVRSIPAAERYIRRYVQCHTIPAAYAEGEVAFDGAVELWFDSVADQQAFFSDPDYLREVQPDESRFADMEQTVFFLTEEEVIIDNG
ncbi:MAG: EthD domain-containing protein [Xanthomonadales bacterium]|nr:EthD domain-containing protein [Xanthomonadales bacterium]